MLTRREIALAIGCGLLLAPCLYGVIVLLRIIVELI